MRGPFPTSHGARERGLLYGERLATRGRVAFNHFGAELRKLLRLPRCARVMRRDPAVLRRETKRQGHVKLGERVHLAVEPGARIRPTAVGPRQAGAQVTNPEALHPAHRLVETVILEVKPLT